MKSRSWNEPPEREATPRELYLRRREFLAGTALAGAMSLHFGGR